MNLLIDRDYILQFKDLSTHTTNERIKEYIRDAQEQDLRPLLGNSFYFDVVKNYLDPTYSDLMNGGEFQKDSCTWEQQGLKMVLMEFFWGRYTYFGTFNDTPYGNTLKLSEFSKNTENKDRKDIWEQSKQRANSYFEIVKQYLDESNFDKWDNGCDCGKFNYRHGAGECSINSGSGFNYSLIK